MESEKDYQDWLKSAPKHFDPDGMAMKIRQQAAEIERLKKALQEEIDRTPCGICTNEIATLRSYVGKLQSRVERLKAQVITLREGLQEVIDFTPNDTDWQTKPTRDECIKEIKYFAELALKDGEE